MEILLLLLIMEVLALLRAGASMIRSGLQELTISVNTYLTFLSDPLSLSLFKLISDDWECIDWVDFLIYSCISSSKILNDLMNSSKTELS